MFNDVVILIPSYEPDNTIISLTNDLLDQGLNVLVVNDGSSSGYDHIFDSLNKQIITLKYDKNKGKGYALKYGFKNVLNYYPECKYVITADGDGQHKVSDILLIYQKMKATNDLTFGVREFTNDVPFRSKFGNNFSKFTRSLTTKEYILDDQCGLRGFPIRYLRVLGKIKGNRYEYEMNQIMLFQHKHYKINYLIIETVYINENQNSHFHPFRDMFRIQCIIFYHSIMSLIALAFTITAFELLIHFTNLHPMLCFLIGECSGFTILFALLSARYATFHTVYRLKKEGLFFLIRLAISFLIFTGCYFLFGGINSAIYGPIIMFLVEFANVLFSYLVMKGKRNRGKRSF